MRKTSRIGIKGRGRKTGRSRERKIHNENIKRQLYLEWEILRRTPEYNNDWDKLCLIRSRSEENGSAKEIRLSIKYGLVQMANPHKTYAKIYNEKKKKLVRLDKNHPFRHYLNPIWSTISQTPIKTLKKKKEIIQNIFGKPITITETINIYGFPYTIMVGINLLFPIRLLESELRKTVDEIIKRRPKITPPKNTNTEFEEQEESKEDFIKRKPILKVIEEKDWPRFFTLIEFDVFQKNYIRKVIRLFKLIRKKKKIHKRSLRIQEKHFEEFVRHIYVYDQVKAGKRTWEIEQELFPEDWKKKKIHLQKINKIDALEDVLTNIIADNLKRERIIKEAKIKFSANPKESDEKYLRSILEQDAGNSIYAKSKIDSIVNNYLSSFQEKIDSAKHITPSHQRTIEKEFNKACFWIEKGGWQRF